MFMPILLILALGFLWIPQIIKNMRNQARKAPSLPFIIIISIEHIYVPVFANLVENNVMENEPKMWVAIVLISVIVVEVFFPPLLDHCTNIAEVEGGFILGTKEMASIPLRLLPFHLPQIRRTHFPICSFPP
eukprot:TRINITY_DN8981_c0_g1_i10.p4 TRINITY_DN8981_c0_g1~~TRINITY_DN8981_c0_g1_i10.p4  ORF type:complete len:132 (+),score=1.21 TRINITY_DN8981_c0_g1_i10:1201-1596(+)